MEIVPGGWSLFEALSSEDQNIFNEALKGFLGVHYAPKTVAKQVVNGINYRYKCKASVPPSEVTWDVFVDIYAPTKGTPHITGITRI